MKRVIAWFAANGVAANLLMIVLLAGGLLTAPTIRQEVFPEFSTDRIVVSVAYPGASPEEIEQAVNARIEERIAGLEGVKKITSTAAEGAGAVTVETLAGFDVRELLSDIKSEVDAIDTFPDEAEEPIVRELVVRHHVISIAVYGDADELTLKRVAERVRDDVGQLPGVTQVELSNSRPYEISIEVSEEALQRYGLTFEDVARAVRRSSVDLPGGSLKTTGGEILLRTEGQAYVGREFERLVLITAPDGARIRLGDVATVDDGFADTDQSAVFDGKPAVMVGVFRVGEQSALEVARRVKQYVREASERMPAGIHLTTWRDRTTVLRGRIDTLRRNGLQGLVLVFLSLALFLQFRLAIWITAGIPVAFLATLWLMPSLDVSINVLSLFSFILVLGIVVDDAIVVGENVYKKKNEEGLSGLEAVVQGTQQVAIPVIFGVLTTVAVFVPMLGLPGTMGKIMRVFPSVVIPTLLFSLVESQLVLPAHLRHAIAHHDHTGPISRRWQRVQGWFAGGLDRFIQRVYRPLLERALSWRYLVAATSVTVLLITTAIVAGGWIRLTFFPDVEADNVIADLTMPRGTPREVTEAAVARLTRAAEQLKEELDAEMDPGRGPAVQHVLTSFGEQPFRSLRSSNGGREGRTFTGSHLAEVNLQLAPAELRRFASSEVAKRWRELAGPIPDAEELSFSATLFNAGAAIAVRLAGNNVDHLIEAADRLKAALAEYPGVYDIADSFQPGKRELELSIKPEAEALGLTLSDLARQVRQAFYGEEAQRVQRGREDVKVMVRFPASERRSITDIENMRIRAPGGIEVPFSTVASAAWSRGYATIQRADRQRIVDVTADVNARVANANEVLADLKRTMLPTLVSDYPGLHYSLEGETREQNETMSSLGRGFAISLLAIFALMAIPLGSYIQPLIVMTAIPFGITGAVWAHILLGMDLTFLSVFGVVALVGVVVNDSLVLVDYINSRRQGGEPITTAVHEAGIARFRPILLTSLTTFAGLTPILLERSLQAQFLVPMAVSLGFGVVFATSVSLILVPCSYLILADLGILMRRRARREAVETETTPQAAPMPRPFQG